MPHTAALSGGVRGARVPRDLKQGRMTDFIDGVFDGYRIQRQVMTLEGEAVFEGERVRDGERVWIWTSRASGSALDPSALREKYEGRVRATRRVGTTGGALGIREIIQIGVAPGLVTEAPRGRSLDDLLADSVQPRSIREVLQWFGPLMATMDTAHSDHIVHGALTPRHVYLDNSHRPTVLGLTETEDDAADAVAQRADVLALATLLYHATTGRPPKAGFPYTGQPASPREIVETFPDGLARFLVQRLAAADDDPVTDACVFRRSLEALSVDPDFRKAAGIEASANDPAPPVVIERDPNKWKRLLVPLAAAGIAAIAMGGITYSVMNVRLDAAERRAAAATAAPPITVVTPPVAMGARGGPTRDAWSCVHAQFGAAGDGALSPEEAGDCVRHSPGVTLADLAAELDRIRVGLSGEAVASDAAASEDKSYRDLFELGADELAMHVRHRLEHQLAMDSLDRWVSRNLTGSVAGIMRTLAARNDAVAIWARGRLGMPP
jgi:hypothetical protein